MNDPLERAYKELDDLINDITKAKYAHANTETYDCLIKKFNECDFIVKRYAKIHLRQFICSSLLLALNVYAIGLGCRVLMSEHCYVLALSTIFNLIVALMIGRITYLQWHLYRHTRESCKYIKQLRISFNYGDHKRTGQSNS